MAYVYVDREGDKIAVRIQKGAQPTTAPKLFDDRKSAEVFAVSKMGRTGCVVSTLDMTPAQLAANAARMDSLKALAVEDFQQGRA